MRKRRGEVGMQEWVSWAFKGLAGVLVSFTIFFVSQLNSSIGALNSTLAGIQAHQIEADKRLTTIEVSREVTMPRYLSIENMVQAMRSQLDISLTDISAIQKTLDRNRIH